MKKDIEAAISEAKNLKQIIQLFNNLCREFRENRNHEKIGYVAGIIFSEGPDHVKSNIENLKKYTEKIRAQNDFPIFSSVDLFYADDFYNKLEDSKLPYGKRRLAFINFYRKILQNNYITDIFMTPRWEQSEGATDEHETAKKQKLTIHYVEES